jgi:hypothetical protein
MRGLADAKALWALLWRILVLTPIATVIGFFGIVLLSLVCAATLAPVLAIAFVIIGEYWWALITVAAWLPWMKFGGPIRRLVFEGFEHGSL